MKSLFFRVTDGNRTRDNRYHNPQLKKTFQSLSIIARALLGAQTTGCARVGAPGADSSDDPLSPLRAWTPGGGR
jgi:hypothetical protein